MAAIEDFLELVRARYSCRDYSCREVEKEKIELCLEAARLAPSACNKQPWRFKVVDDEALVRRLSDEALLPGLPMPWLDSAPVIVALCAETSVVTHRLAPLLSKIDYRLIDIGISGEHFALAAAAQGLATCWIGWFSEKRVKRVLGLKRGMRVVSLMSLGYPAESGGSPEKKALDEIVV
jgi:nitroreductase